MAKGGKKRMMNPILIKELKLGARSIRLPLSIMFYDIVLAIVAVIAILIVSLAGSDEGGVNFSGFLYIFEVIGWIQMAITLLIVPILTAGAISGEREKQTLEIMLTTPEKPLAIVWGKLLASLSNYLIFIISSIPIMAIAFVLGGLNWFALLGYMVMMIIMAIYVGSIGIFCSSEFKKTIVSIVMTFLLEFALLAIPVFLFFGIIVIGAIIHEYLYYDANIVGIPPDPNFGLLPFIMIGNPLTGFLDYMLRSIDVYSLSELLKDSDAFGTIMPILAHAWIPLNILACGGISYFFLKMAAKKLNPIKKMKKKKRPVTPVPVPNPNQTPAQGMPQLYQPQQMMPMQQGNSPEQAVTAPMQQGSSPEQAVTAPVQQGSSPQQAVTPTQESTAITEQLIQPGVTGTQTGQQEMPSRD